MDEDEVISLIDNYVKNVKIDYAILLDGAWGSGKTKFIQEKVIKKLNDDYKKESQKQKMIKMKTLKQKDLYIYLYMV